jgi:hypothetical protein
VPWTHAEVARYITLFGSGGYCFKQLNGKLFQERPAVCGHVLRETFELGFKRISELQSFLGERVGANGLPDGFI